MLDRRGNLVFWDNHFFESLRFQGNIMVPLRIPTPATAPDRGGPIACLGGPVARCTSRNMYIHTGW